MEKEAIAAKKLLKILGASALGTGTVGGSAVLGHKVGFRSGANRTADEMAAAFSDANQRENSRIVSSFKLFNKKENKNIASNYFKKGIAIGAQLQANGKLSAPQAASNTLMKTSSLGEKEMDKVAFLEEAYNKAFENEIESLEKDAAIGGLLMKGLKTLKGSYKNLGSGLKAMKNAKNIGAVKNQAISTAKNSKAALATTGAAAYAAS